MVNFNKILLFASAFLLLVQCDSSPKTKVGQEKAEAPKEETQKPKDAARKVVLFFGNSLTAAYGLDPSEGFTGLLQQRLDSLHWPVEVVNAGVTGETTATGRNRVDWVIERQHVDVFVLELGANDGLRGIPVEETERNLKAMISKVREHYPDVEIVLAGMMVPPNMGEEYSGKFQAVFPRVAEEEDVHLIPFLLEGVAGEAELNLEDGIHPNKKGHRIVAENIWTTLRPVLKNQIQE